MQNTKNNSATLCVKLSQEKFSKHTSNLFSNYVYDDIKPTIDNLLLGWIGSDFDDYNICKNKSQNLDLFTKSLTFFEKAEKLHKENKEITIDFFDGIMHQNFEHNFKSVKKNFRSTLNYFLSSNLANNQELRCDVLYRVSLFAKYFIKIYKIKENLQ